MLNDIYIQLHNIPQAFLIAVLLSFVFLFVKDNKNESKEKLKCFFLQDKAIALFLFYTALLLVCTIIGRPHTNPFINIIGKIRIVDNGIVNYGGLENIVMFIPYTLLYNIAFKPHFILKKSMCLTIITTVFIEIFQLLFWVGQFSFADLLHNTIGGIIGCGLWYIYMRISKWMGNRDKRDKSPRNVRPLS